LLTHPTVRLNHHHIRDLLAEESLQVSADMVRRLRRQRGLPPKHQPSPPGTGGGGRARRGAPPWY